MANRYVGTVFYSGAAFAPEGAPGWSETFIIQAPDYTTAAADLSAISTQRLATLAPDVSLIGSRLSDTDVKGDSFPTGIAVGPGTYNPGGAMTSYNPDLALRVQFFGGTLKRSNRFWHAIPKDSVNASGGYGPVAGFITAMNTLNNQVQISAGIGTKIKGAVVPPFYAFTAITAFQIKGLEKHAIGSPFGRRRGRRLIA
jgi:hypothetical protein